MKVNLESVACHTTVDHIDEECHTGVESFDV